MYLRQTVESRHFGCIWLPRVSGHSHRGRRPNKERLMNTSDESDKRPIRQTSRPQEKEDEGEDEEEDEDQLTAIVRRQREQFSARAAAGRPSARNTKSAWSSDGERRLSGSNSAAMTRATQSNRVLREWKSLARKVICKVARQWLGSRRDKLTMAKRTARECARLLRQRALLSQKCARDAISRGHRLTREIATHWRNSATNTASGSGPLAINGVTLPTAASTTGVPVGLQYSDYYPAGKPEGNSGETPVVESAAAARRRAERAAAEQRRADLELLEARRQQRKLNFLITQTELYAHFMARKMDGAQDSVSQSTPGGHLESDFTVKSEVSVEEAETARILNRLDDSDEESHEAEDVSLVETQAEAGDEPHSVPTGETSSDTKSQGCVSIAVAARAAANRLGIRTEDEYDVKNLKTAAIMKAKEAVKKEQERKSQFQQAHHIHPSVTTETSGCELTDQTTGAAPQVEAPKLFKGQLKAYQIRGLNWLLGLFDQGINGILADEMGLGKTIQTIAFLGYLAETYHIWGPFLIITPASTLHNWTQEFAKFLPSFRLVPYWGSPTERKVLRRFWSSMRSSTTTLAPSEIDGNGDMKGQPGTKDAEMHVVVTSYQVVLQDAKFINKTAWSYIVLDEAHAIKSTSSLRWRILLSFKCRNRLLLTGTPIQNTMQELWALLHFIMPTLFDSHDEFANWFSRDIESQASASTGGGGGGLSTSKLNENQLSRLHLILKPFMLRRTKTEVENEISTKTEILRYCPLSHRQHHLYNLLRNKIRLEDLSSVIGSGGVGKSQSIDEKNSESTGASATAHLINLVMQLRKICNHPDLWERRDVQLTCISGSVRPTTTTEEVFYTSACSENYSAPVWHLPKLLHDEGLLPCLSWNHLTGEELSGSHLHSWPVDHHCGLPTSALALITRLFAVFHPAHIHADLWKNNERNDQPDENSVSKSKCFSFSRLMGLSPYELSVAAITNGASLLVDRRITGYLKLILLRQIFDSESDGELGPQQQISPLLRCFPPTCFERMRCSSASAFRSMVDLSLWPLQPDEGQWVPRFQASPWDLTSPATSMELLRTTSYVPGFVAAATITKVLLRPLELHVSIPYFRQKHDALCSRRRPVSFNVCLPASGPSVGRSTLDLLPAPPRSLELVSAATRISDSGKLIALDSLLSELKPAGHRVLIYSQMTRMIDILEEFMLYRKHAYLRLDGSSRLSDRRDMVAQWQTNPRWFVFLLSTRAGGLGINLTAADTVIFYDSDWNPTVDQQAMDRAHRLGQTKPVTVYRLVCKNTVEGRMMRRAEEKRAMQHMVIRSGTNSLLATKNGDDQLTSTDMVSLLLDDEELVKRLQIRRRLQPQRGRPTKNHSAARLTAATIDNQNQLNTSTPNTVQSGGGNPSFVPSPGRMKLPEDPLARKRQAAWAERTRGGCGRPKKFRPLGSAPSADSTPPPTR
ncbi:unnamed protein product [Calicophoron daubneyi]|uniref:Chromatin-remodeling ATPase INO80 n=1 Tax=Calicophoron daubneyi TaxID=300641 RepID=A0AAV2TVU0_CALDB